MLRNKTFLSTLLALIILSSAPSVLADYGQYGQYSQPVPAQSIIIDKMVGKASAPTKGGVVNVEYVDNLSPADIRFKPGYEIMFRLKVKNTSSVTLSNVTVKDFIPAYMEPIEGPGAWDSVSRTISFDAGSFAPNEEKVYFIKAQLYGQDKMPADKGLFCLTNRAQAYNEAVSDDDSAQFCIEKEVIGAKEAPKAGPEAGILVVGLNTLIAGIGFGLKRMTRRGN